MRPRRQQVHAALLLLITVLAAACSGTPGTDPVYNGTTPNVLVLNDTFSPAATTVPVGTTVTWSWNTGGATHNVTFDDGVTSSPTLGSGSHTRTFGASGTFAYHCTLHAGMNGTVTVQ